MFFESLLAQFLEAVAGTICGREEALQTRFAARAGGAFVSRVRDAAARAMQIMIAKGMNETEVSLRAGECHSCKSVARRMRRPAPIGSLYASMLSK